MTESLQFTAKRLMRDKLGSTSSSPVTSRVSDSEYKLTLAEALMLPPCASNNATSDGYRIEENTRNIDDSIDDGYWACDDLMQLQKKLSELKESERKKEEELERAKLAGSDAIARRDEAISAHARVLALLEEKNRQISNIKSELGRCHDEIVLMRQDIEQMKVLKASLMEAMTVSVGSKNNSDPDRLRF